MKALLIYLIISYTFATTKENFAIERSVIGSTFSSPIIFENNLYFVATNGVLFQSKLDLSSPIKLYEGKRQTLGSAILKDNILYWGDGLHQDKITTLHAFDLKAKKMLIELDVEGHIERAPFINEGTVFVGLGPGGIIALKERSLEKIWQTKNIDKNAIHADGNFLIFENKICTPSIYHFKGIICLNLANGKIVNSISLNKDPKSEITSFNNSVVGFATDANLKDAKWTTHSDLYVVDVINNKITLQKDLRGFNFFAPPIIKNSAFVTLSTGDFITVSLIDGKIGYLGQYSEPFINNAFINKDNYCAIGIMGKYLCFNINKNGPGITQDKRFLETPIGKTSLLNGKYYAPSRIGYFIIE